MKEGLPQRRLLAKEEACPMGARVIFEQASIEVYSWCGTTSEWYCFEWPVGFHKTLIAMP